MIELESEKEWITSLIEEGNQDSTLVFVDGIFRKELSFIEGIVLEERDGELRVTIPPKTILENPIQVLYVSAERDAQSTLKLYIGKEAEVQWISKQVCLDQPLLSTHQNFDVSLDDGASFFQFDALNFNQETKCFRKVNATLEANSRYHYLSFTKGSKMVQQDISVSLVGENSEADVKGMSLLNEKRESHVNTFLEHRAPHTRSNQCFKNVLSDFSRGSFEGKIFVKSEAQKTEAYQLNRNLILSERAMMVSKPNLEVFADDVKASHGSTTSQLKEEELFYLRSRGLSYEEAKQYLIEGFCKELIKDSKFAPLMKEYYA